MSTTQMSDPRELFLHELGDVLYAERMLVKALPKLLEEASDEELAKGFGDHLEETRQHVKNIEQAFQALGRRRRPRSAPASRASRRSTMTSLPTSHPPRTCSTPSSRGAGARTEHYEIAAYEGLMTMADAMGEDEVARLLGENLEHEKTALRKMQTIGKRLAEVGAKATA